MRTWRFKNPFGLSVDRSSFDSASLRSGRTVGVEGRTTASILALLLASTASLAAERTAARIVVQNAPLAGFVYYDGQALWDRMKTGDRLTLTRERDNPHDANAVRLEWRGRMLGYVPRKDNADLARQMDHGAKVEARITELSRLANGRHRISYEISVPLRY